MTSLDASAPLPTQPPATAALVTTWCAAPLLAAAGVAADWAGPALGALWTAAVATGIAAVLIGRGSRKVPMWMVGASAAVGLLAVAGTSWASTLEKFSRVSNTAAWVTVVLAAVATVVTALAALLTYALPVETDAISQARLQAQLDASRVAAEREAAASAAENWSTPPPGSAALATLTGRQPVTALARGTQVAQRGARGDGPRVPGWNVAARASLLALLPLAPLAAVLAHIALHQIKRTGERGRAMAILVLVLSYGILGFFAVAFIWGEVSS